METELTKIETENPDAFKSYYVVWKLQQQYEKQQHEKRLNRTMQYGNSDDINTLSDEEIV